MQTWSRTCKVSKYIGSQSAEKALKKLIYYFFRDEVEASLLNEVTHIKALVTKLQQMLSQVLIKYFT